MPYYADFSRLYGRGDLQVRPKGWTKLTIEYGYGNVGNILNFFWRVQGTQHTFRIPLQTINQDSQGDYEKHIESFLEGFREEYLSWVAQGFKEEWMVEYHKEYRNYLEI